MQAITKKELRAQILTLLRNQKEEKRLEKSKAIGEKLLKMAGFSKAKTILFYMPFDGEVDTFDMMKLAQKIGKKVGLPKILKDDKTLRPILIHSLETFEDGPFGIKQPKETEGNTLNVDEIDMVVVPGLAFDRENYRLGRGQGYYDRFLKLLPSVIPTVGLAFDFQLIDHLPQKVEHDVPVSHVLSN